CDIDPMARDAALINAQLNEVNVSVSAQLPAPGEADLITAADVLYDPDNLPLLQQFQQLSKQVLLADSRIKVLPVDFLKQLTVREARTWPDLNEFEEFNQVRLYAS
ncbi:MAG: methyltransferase type 12, partial [Oleiphilaceae bacterium]|nr:methyltransferase type 12 [Oleiphilaceae bacterium]